MSRAALRVSSQHVRLLVPPLSPASHKGSAGKIGVVGGCAEYTGAPFYAAMSALKLGADLSHVFCAAEAAGPIKSYSPELIVHGCLRENEPSADARVEQADAVSKWFPALTALVVGPGLGRDETLQDVARIVVERAVAASLPLVIDADGLWLVLADPSRVRGSAWTVLTPNKPEFARLANALGEGTDSAEDDGEEAQLLRMTRALDGPTIVRKGQRDLLCDGSSIVVNDEPGSLKRSGGQGDVLAGSIATLLSWGRGAGERLPADAPSAPLLAAYGGCVLTRRFSAAAFSQRRRAMTAPDLIEAIGPTFDAFVR